ncbi:unnamed protein product [Caretta caretta]
MSPNLQSRAWFKLLKRKNQYFKIEANPPPSVDGQAVRNKGMDTLWYYIPINPMRKNSSELCSTSIRWRGSGQ